MAWQLIYTSAPRLLEAGRSGFGTVARHQKIPALLVAAIERVSQFSRLPGLDTNRVIYAYRQIAVGGGRFHVLSCIRDAGASFTGRTNHLAQHLIAEQREVAALGPHGPSPADVLLAFPWRAAWDDTARWLEAVDEFPLTQIPPQTASDGAWWASVTGNPAHAWLLAQGETSRSAALIVPPHCNLRALFAESLRLTPERLWLIPFTTDLQPSDDASEFRWVGVGAAENREGSLGQRLIDLTNPRSLPVPEVPVTPVAIAASQSATTSPVIQPHVSPATSTPSLSPHVAKKADDPFGGYAPKRARSGRWLWIAASVLLLAGAATTAVVIVKKKEARAEAIDHALRPIHGIAFFDQRNLRQDLLPQIQTNSAAQLPRLRELLDFAAGLSAMLAKPDFNYLRADPAPAKAQALAKGAAINLPRAIASLAENLDRAAALEGELHKFQPQAVGIEGFRQFQRRCAEALVSSVNENTPHEFSAINRQLTALAARQQASALRHLLGDDAMPSEKDTWFRDVRKNIPSADGDEAAAYALKEVDAILDGWRYVTNGTPEGIARWLETESKEQPTWLRRLAREKSAPPKTATGTAENIPGKTTPVAPKPAPVTTGAIHFAGSKVSLAKLTIKELRANQQFELIGSDGAVTKLSFKNGATVRRNVQSNNDGFKIEGQNIAAEPGAPPPPFQLAARDPVTGAEVFRVYVGAVDRDKPLFGAFTNQLQKDGHFWRVTADFPRPSPETGATLLLLGTKPPYPGEQSLRLPCDTQLQVSVERVTARVQEQIKTLRDTANERTKQASALIAGGASTEELKKTAVEYAAIITNETAKKSLDPQAKSPAQLVGDFGVALATQWQEEAKTSKDEQKAAAFEAIRKQSSELANAVGGGQKARDANSALLKVISEKDKDLRTKSHTEGLGRLRSLAQKLNAVLGDPKELEAAAARLQAAAEEAERAAKAIETSPSLIQKIPADTYTLMARLPDGLEIKLCTITVTDQP